MITKTQVHLRYKTKEYFRSQHPNVCSCWYWYKDFYGRTTYMWLAWIKSKSVMFRPQKRTTYKW